MSNYDYANVNLRSITSNGEVLELTHQAAKRLTEIELENSQNTLRKQFFETPWRASLGSAIVSERKILKSYDECGFVVYELYLLKLAFN